MFRSIRTISVLKTIISNESKSIRCLSTLQCIHQASDNSKQFHRINNNNFLPNISCEYSTGASKKPKKNKPAVDHIGRLDLRVGKIIEIKKADDAETLYLTKVDCGKENERNIVAGLAKSLPADELQNRMVVVLCNLKPSKLRGYLSEGMILCATNGSATEPIEPPKNAEPGDIVHCENYEREPVETPRDKKKLFDPLADDLCTNEQAIVCYKGSFLYIPEKGNISVKTLKNSSII